MWRWKTIAVIILFLGQAIQAQEYDSFDVIAEFIGNVSVEDADPDEVERLTRYIQRPLRINVLGLTRIKESGLLTHYQTVSLMDYRVRHGDILSLTELAAVDGFGQDFVRKLAPFISLESTRQVGQRYSEERRIYQESQMKGGVRCNDGLKGQYALKYRIEAGDQLQASFALSKSTDSKWPDSFTGNMFWNFRRHPVKLAVGSFNARFGQGLALWNGMSISGLSKPSAYLKRSSGLSPSFSYTGNYAFKGLAAETMLRRLRLTILTALSGSKENVGILPAANLTWLCPKGQFGLTHFTDIRFSSNGANIPDMKTSFDIAFTVQGMDFFTETAYDWVAGTAATLAGVVFPSGEYLRMASMLRYYSSSYQPTYSAAARALTECSNEYGASFSGEFSGGQWVNINGADGFGSSSRRFQGSVCMDGAYFPVSKSEDVQKSVQLKALAEIKIQTTEAIALKLRLSERVRTWGNPFRTDIRTDVFYYSRLLDAVLRANIVKCIGTSFLSYAECTVKLRSFKMNLRSGVFFADNWDDRIYAYERDIPGTFNVPAFYGRGYWIALTGNWKFAKWGRVHLRGALTEYPFMEKKKPGKAELKLMLEIRI